MRVNGGHAVGKSTKVRTGEGKRGGETSRIATGIRKEAVVSGKVHPVEMSTIR